MSTVIRPLRLTPRPEWPASLDVPALLSGGWRPRPFRNFVLKIHSRCDLRCDYCYVFQMADQSWRDRPRTMSPATIELVAGRIAEHVGRHALAEIEVILHGGEPLLAGPEVIAHAVATVRAAVGPATHVRASIQTNAVRLNTDYLRLFDELDILVGVSLDGDQLAHDRHRRGPSGRGSYAAVAAALRGLAEPRYRRLFGGLLSVIDLRADPIGTYEALLGFAPPAIDFLLPHGNWSQPPRGRVPGSPATPYAAWLINVFDRWYDAPRQETGVRLFEELINLLLGGASRAEGVGLAPVGVVVVETDGGIGQSDMLASAYRGAAETGLHVRRDSFDSALLLPGIAARQLGRAGLAAQCRSCEIHRVCGGGLYPHRYQAGRGFDNPSVYCPDLYRLIVHVRERLAGDLRALAEAHR
jgi:uncharacterized protein